MKLAILLTCFNRKAKTLACLDSLFKALALTPEIEPTVYLVDDGSTDGTGDAVRSAYPQINVLQGSGNLYWNGGMNHAWENAHSSAVEYAGYLLINDDSIFTSTAFTTLLSCITKTNSPEYILVGSFQSYEKHGTVTYGGVRRNNKLHPLKFQKVAPLDTELVRVHTFNANLVFINQGTYKKLGMLSTHYLHSFGDYDYGLRATKQNIPVLVLPGFVGFAENDHSISGSWLDTTLPLKKRLQIRESFRGVPRKDWFHFTTTHGGILGPLLFCTPYIKIVISSIIARFKRWQS